MTELESLDELNYLGELLKMQFDDDREKFAAAITYGDHTRDLQDIINLAQNLDSYWIYPSVKTEEDYGHYPVSYTHLGACKTAGRKRGRLPLLVLVRL